LGVGDYTTLTGGSGTGIGHDTYSSHCRSEFRL
jgi:hypothetical protein